MEAIIFEKGNIEEQNVESILNSIRNSIRIFKREMLKNGIRDYNIQFVINSVAVWHILDKSSDYSLVNNFQSQKSTFEGVRVFRTGDIEINKIEITASDVWKTK